MKPISTRRWRQRPFAEEALPRLMEQHGLSPLVAQVLAHRGLTESEAVDAFFDVRLQALPDPSLMLDMDRAADRLARAVQQGEKIAIHGDYDVDGMTACALMVEGIRALGGTADYFIPLRLADGYGLSAEALQTAHRQGASVAVSVDCGVTAVEEARLAGKLGLDLIITDHHQPPETLPEAFAVIDPHRSGDPFPWKEIAGVGVAFFLLIALRRALRQADWFDARPEPDVRDALDLVALGTVADVAPMTGGNRVLVRAGLVRIAAGGRPGLVALKRVAGVKQVTAGAIGFQLGPRLNAAGRLDDATRGVELLLTSDAARARTIADDLDRLNAERQAVEAAVLQEAIATLEEGDDTPGIVLAREGWHPGVIGIVASRLVERFHRPTVLIALENGTGKGSGRTAGGFDLYGGLLQCADTLNAFGGHRAAAGVSLDRDRLAEFSAAFYRVVDANWPADDRLPILEYDGNLELSRLTPAAVEELALLGPHGIGHPAPLLRLSGVRVRDVQRVGEGHLRFQAVKGTQRVGCIGFGLADRQPLLAGEVDLLCAPDLNIWKGRSAVQLRVKDIRTADSCGGGKE